jgi:hypothetical protein
MEFERKFNSDLNVEDDRYTGGDFTFTRGSAAGKTIQKEQLNEWMRTLIQFDTDRVFYHWPHFSTGIRYGINGISEGEINYFCDQKKSMTAGGG